MSFLNALNPFSKINKLTESLDDLSKKNVEINEKLRLYNEIFTADRKAFTDKFSSALKNNNQNEAYVAHQLLAALSTTYTKISDERRIIIKEVDKLKPFYLADAIITQLTEDALSPEVTTNDVVNVYSKNPVIDRELKALEEKIGFDDLVLSICPDMLRYGEYTLSTRIEKGVGLKEVVDDVDINSVIALTKNGIEIDGFLKKTRDKLIKRSPSDFVQFSLSNNKVKIDLMREFNLDSWKETDLYKDFPKFVRVGRSVLYPVIQKLKELELLEQLVPATKLAKLSTGTLVGINVPQGATIDVAQSIVRKIEETINKKVGLDQGQNEITLENVMASSGRYKVIPIFGDKGRLEKFDYHSNEAEDLFAGIVDLRKTILSSAGIPYEIIFGSDDEKKGNILRKYARYIRKLKAIQRSIVDGLYQICLIHLVNKGIPVIPSDIKIEFRHNLIEISNLDELEFMDTTVAMLVNLQKFVMDISDNPVFEKYIDVDVFKDYLNKQFSIVGLKNLMKEKEIEKEEVVNLTNKEKETGNFDRDVFDTNISREEEPETEQGNELTEPEKNIEKEQEKV